MENFLSKPGGNGNLYDGRIFSNEELKLLSNETRRLYDSFFNRDYSVTALRQYDYDQIVKIINEVIQGLKQQREDITGFYAREKMNAFGVKIMNDIISKRNSIVERKKWDKIEDSRHLENLNESLEFLINNNNDYNFGLRVINRIEYVNEVIKKQAKQIKETIEKDMIALPQYASQYQKVQSRYMQEKAKWERKSRLGQFLGRLTGKDKAFNDARRQAASYNSVRAMVGNTTIIQNGKYVEATNINRINDDYLFVKPTMPVNYENIEFQEQPGRGR